MQEEPGRSMDLSENWSLEEGSWLSHTGAQHFPSTRAGMATLHGPDSLGISPSCPSLCQPVCTPRLPGLVGSSRAAGWSLLSWDLEVRQTYVQIPKAFIVTYVTIRNTIALGRQGLRTLAASGWGPTVTMTGCHLLGSHCVSGTGISL